MGRKKTGAIPTAQPKEKQKMVIDMTKIELAKAYHVPGFRTGKHMTEKDKPRKKNWKKEYERGKGSDLYGDYRKDPFFVSRNFCTWRRTGMVVDVAGLSKFVERYSELITPNKLNRCSGDGKMFI